MLLTKNKFSQRGFTNTPGPLAMPLTGTKQQLNHGSNLHSRSEKEERKAKNNMATDGKERERSRAEWKTWDKP